MQTSAPAAAAQQQQYNAPVQLRVGGHPRADVGQGVAGGHHEDLEDEDDVAEEPELGVVVHHLAALPREVPSTNKQ
jgi:hypothetical protein